jgi:hypothetical protein
MKTKLSFNKVLMALGIIFIVIQFFRIDRNPPVSDPTKDFIKVTQPDSEIAAMLNSSCYDCHSNSTIYPWYTNFSPVSWWIKHHIDEGRAELNFSMWDTYSSRKKDHKLKEAVEMVESGEMPMESYIWMHGNAELSEIQKEKLIAYFNSLRTFESDKEK